MWLTKRQGDLLFVVLLAFGMSMVMSFFITLVNTSFDARLPQRWLKAWIISFAIAVPTALVLAPLCRRLANACSSRGRG